MNRIQILSKQVTELIAAGEVVERPASVVKEIMENSIDAGASSITLEIKNGGITFIRITDNGSGITKDDIIKAFLSHATSKINSADDLNAIETLGFRGEALASIAAVSKVEMITRAEGEELGSRYCIEGGEQILFDDAGCPKGTTLIIRDLFFNTPARMKFLKKDVSEANAVAGVIDRIALSHPEVAVRFIRDGKQTLLTSGDGKLSNAIYAIFGKDFAAGLISTDFTLENIRVSGFVSKPIAARPNRSMQFFFLNGRLIKTGTGSTALTEAYKNSIMVGKFPSCVLNIEISPEQVDVNVHPSKIEARFANEKQLFNAIFYCVKNAIQSGDSRPNIELTKAAVNQYFNAIDQVQQIKFPVKNEGFWVNKTANEPKSYNFKIDITVDEDEIDLIPATQANYNYETNASQPAAQTSAFNEGAESKYQTAANSEQSAAPSESLADVAADNQAVSGSNEENFNTDGNEVPEENRILILGEAFKTYIIAESGDKVLIIDKHAAHERIIFDRLIAREPDESSQIMLLPITVTLSKEEYSAVLENTELLAKAGFEVEDFGAGMVIVRECPMMLDIGSVEDVMMELAGYLLSNKREIISEKLEWLFHSIACRAAIKAGDFTSELERERFVETLLKLPDIRYCPHGRPVLIEMKRKELEKSFGRT
ncbi:MAG: DNA mismatch repair endonuclease MutL [Eubacteriales bacterium]